MGSQIRTYIESMAAQRAALAQERPGDSLAVRVKKRLVRSSTFRYRSRLWMTHVLEPYSRRRAARLAATGGPIRLNLGSYLSRKPGFYNVDLAGIPVDLAWDISRPLPFADGSVDAVAHDHTLEHLDLVDGLALTTECFRVLRSGGRLRVSVPDAAAVVRDYVAERTFVAPTPMLELQRLFYEWGHRTMYDAETLSMLMAECGFVETRVCAFRDSAIEPCPDVEARIGTLYVEAVKPAGAGAVGHPHAGLLQQA